MSRANLWFSYTLKPYNEKEETFYNPANFEWTKLLEDNFEIIQEEVLAFLERDSLVPYFNRSLLETPGSWKSDSLLHWGIFLSRNASYFKKSWSVIKKIPGISAFSVSKLEPNGIINPHKGDTNAIIRVHLPIIVPEGMPNCYFSIGEDKRAWQLGKPLLFNDAQVHEAKNKSNKARVVLILDVIRPEFLSQKYQISAKVLNGLNWQRMTQKNPNVRKYPMAFLKVYWSIHRFYLRGMLRLNRLFVWP